MLYMAQDPFAAGRKVSTELDQLHYSQHDPYGGGLITADSRIRTTFAIRTTALAA